MKELPLTNGQFALVDDEDFERLSVFKWERIGAERFSIYRRFTVNRKTYNVSLANEIMLDRTYQMYDHKDRNPFNNQKNNIRPCTRSENQANRTRHSESCVSDYRGVSLHRQTGKWTAEIWKNRKKHYLGIFIEQIDAAKAYDKKAKELHGEFALLNFPIKESND